MIYFGERCYSNQYDEISDDEISGFANTTKFPPPFFVSKYHNYCCAIFIPFDLEPDIERDRSLLDWI